LDKLRQTGRTTRLLKYAIELAKNDPVTIVALNYANIDNMLNICCNICTEGKAHNLRFYPDSTNIKSFYIIFTTPYSEYINFESMSIRGISHKILVDHFVIESRFSKMLEMLHMFDD
jgi:hypothetical protein